MGKFSSSKIFYNCDSYIDKVAKQFSEQMQQEGFDINAQKISDGKWNITIKKGGMFKAILGMKSALKIEMHSTSPNVLVKTGVGIFAQQAIPTMITMLVLWPVLLAQIWGMIKQSKLDTHVMEVLQQDFSTAMGQTIYTQDVE
ncbi:MAG: hypothetical protein PUD79_04540 [Prevotellaceae bacterium]|nr:hypothetical protein [Prevotellaceae bacterium]